MNMCYKQKCKVVPFNLAHPVDSGYYGLPWLYVRCCWYLDIMIMMIITALIINNIIVYMVVF